MKAWWYGAATALGCGVVVAAAVPTRAQDEVPIEGADAEPVDAEPSARDEAVEILVTATRREAESFRVPWSTDVVGHDEIFGRRLRRTVPDAMADVPGVMVQKTSYGQGSPFLRGFTGYHAVMLVDGVRLNNSTFRSGPNQYWGTVDPYTVDRLEVVRGTSSVLYGSDAVGGTVNAVARRHRDFEPGLHATVRNVLRVASAENSFGWRVETEGNQDDLGWFAGATYRSFGDIEAGRGTRRVHETGYRDADGDVRLDWRTDVDSAWALGVQHVDQDQVPRTHTTVHGEPFHGTTVGDELRRALFQTRDLVYLRHARSLDAPLADLVSITGSWHLQRETQERDRDASRSDEQGYDVETLGLQAQAEKRSPIGELTYGAEYWHDSVDSFRRDYVNGAVDLERVQGPVADDAAYDLLGVYAQDEFQWCETTITAGARFTYAAARARRVDNPLVGGGDPSTPGNVIDLDDSWTNVVGSLRAVHPLAEGWNVFGGVSQGFRAPNLSDLTRLDDTSGVETPSLGLDPEEFLQTELGVKTRHERWSGQASVWTTEIDDLIVPSPTGRRIGSTPEVRKDNVGDGRVSGVEAETSVQVDDAWTVTLAGSYQRGSVTQLLPNGDRVRRPASRLLPLTGVLTLGYHEPQAPWRAWISARAGDAQDRLSLKDETDTERIPPGGTPGYTVVSLGAAFDLCENASLSIVLENVGNVDYRVHGSGVNEAGRNLVVALDLSF